MSQHPLLAPGPAATVVVPRSPSRPSDLEPLSREHSRPAWVPGSELVQESSRQGLRSANPQPRLLLSRDQIFPLKPLHRKADSIASSNVTRTFKHSLHMKKL